MAISPPEKKRIFIIHGPNLNLLGSRDPEQYGTLTLDKVNTAIRKKARELDLETRIIQTNHEGRIIDLLHRRRKWADGIIVNPGAFTHYSYAIRDAIEGIQIPVVEVHLSNIYEREDFRSVSVTKDVCVAQFYGKKVDSYLEALTFLSKHLTPNS
ncbi:MAG: 3-dehydroquinate dehydratase [Candidatus Marinimicrobia bacterium]|nr:3-dehydroquinate dehydratase [FCB group bacterium]MBL7026294.1 3-dehydroquinate dehydratase [Candidatus Neomarinimicrobiota bacterium]